MENDSLIEKMSYKFNINHYTLLLHHFYSKDDNLWAVHTAVTLLSINSFFPGYVRSVFIFLYIGRITHLKINFKSVFVVCFYRLTKSATYIAQGDA